MQLDQCHTAIVLPRFQGPWCSAEIPLTESWCWCSCIFGASHGHSNVHHWSASFPTIKSNPFAKFWFRCLRKPQITPKFGLIQYGRANSSPSVISPEMDRTIPWKLQVCDWFYHMISKWNPLFIHSCWISHDILHHHQFWTISISIFIHQDSPSLSGKKKCQMVHRLIRIHHLDPSWNPSGNPSGFTHRRWNPRISDPGGGVFGGVGCLGTRWWKRLGKKQW